MDRLQDIVKAISERRQANGGTFDDLFEVRNFSETRALLQLLIFAFSSKLVMAVKQLKLSQDLRTKIRPNKQPFTLVGLRTVLAELIYGSTINTTNALQCALSFAAMNPDIQKRVGILVPFFRRHRYDSFLQRRALNSHSPIKWTGVKSCSLLSS